MPEAAMSYGVIEGGADVGCRGVRAVGGDDLGGVGRGGGLARMRSGVACYCTELHG